MKTATVYIFPMRKKERVWEVIRLRSKGEFLGRITAPDEEAALKKAIEEFQIAKTYEQYRLIVRRLATSGTAGRPHLSKIQ